MFITDGASPLGFLKQQVTVPKGVQPPKVIMEWHDQTFRPLPKSKWSFSKITGAIRHGLPHLKDNWVDDSVPGKITCKTKSRKKVLVSVVGQEIDFKIRVWVDGRDERLDEVAYVNCDENVQKLINKGVAFAFIEVLSGEHEVIAEIVKRECHLYNDLLCLTIYARRWF